ncbi:MAG: pyrroline-5-carboxylate reductase dimerization domain-containing protein [Merdibacter sp.]
MESAQHPGALKDAVCSPKGTTIRGICALEESGFRAALIRAIDAIEGR